MDKLLKTSFLEGKDFFILKGTMNIDILGSVLLILHLILACTHYPRFTYPRFTYFIPLKRFYWCNLFMDDHKMYQSIKMKYNE